MKPADVVGGNTALLVGRTGQRYHGLVAGDEVSDFHGVAHGINVLVLRAHVIVHQNAALGIAGQACFLGQTALRPDAHGEYDHIGGHVAGGSGDGHGAVPLHDTGDSGTQHQLQTLFRGVVVDIGSHIRVQRGNQMIGHLHNGHIQTGVQEVFGHFHANVAAADNDGLFALAESHHLVPDGVGVGDVAQGEDVGGLGALDGRHQGLGAGGENQLVIGFGVLPVLLEIVDGDGLPGTVDGHHLRQHTDVNAEPVVKALRRLQRQGALFGDLTADIVG